MTALLLFTATLLGLLAFFEPCTIASHTLYSVRNHQQTKTSRCCQSLLALWASRSLLLIGLFTLSVALTTPPVLGPWMPSIILAIMAFVYLLSRFVYIPIPHLEFFRLIPGGKALPHALQLGLTLPACTLPLIIIVAGMAITVDSYHFAALAGLLFSSLFTLPLVISSYRGIHEDGLDLLNRAAKGSPYLTAVLLLSLSLYMLIPSIDISSDALSSTLDHASLTGIGLAFLAGFVFSFNPVSFASIPVMLAYVTKAHEERRAIAMGSAFVAGLVLTHVVLGVAAALGGDWVKSIMGRQWGLFLGPLLIFMGLMWSGLIKIRLPWFGARGHRVTGLWGAFLLAIPFSVAVCPFCTPALMVTLTASAAIGSVSFGFLLLLAFALGRSIPVILGAWSMGWLESLKIVSHYQRVFEILAGITLVLTGLYLLNEYYFIIDY